MSYQSTYKELWTRVLLYAPECPLPLAQEFVNTAYRRALDWYPWSQSRVEDEFVIPDTYSTGTASVVQGSTIVTGVGTVWTSDMQYRQFMTIGSTSNGAAPYYTIMSVDVGAQTLTLDRDYEKATNAAATYQINQVYVSVPSNFGYWDGVRDLFNNWKLFPSYTQSQLDAWDAIRSTSGTPWVLASAPALDKLDGAAPTKRYELWPRSTPITRTYAYRYFANPEFSATTDRPIAPITGDVLRKGALAELAIWPGTSTSKNPYFSLETHEQLEKEFQRGLGECWKRDNELSQTAVKYADWDDLMWAPIDARFLQDHAIF